MEYFEAPAPSVTNLPSVFLAGGITDCLDWQAEARELFAEDNVAVINPRRKVFPSASSVAYTSASEQQITWEFNALAGADVVMFWFPAGTSLQPIALYELGRHGGITDNLVVGRDPGYLRAQNVDVQMRLARPAVPLHDSLNATVCRVRRMLSGMPA